MGPREVYQSYIRATVNGDVALSWALRNNILSLCPTVQVSCPECFLPKDLTEQGDAGFVPPHPHCTMNQVDRRGQFVSGPTERQKYRPGALLQAPLAAVGPQFCSIPLDMG